MARTVIAAGVIGATRVDGTRSTKRWTLYRDDTGREWVDFHRDPNGATLGAANRRHVAMRYGGLTKRLAREVGR